MGFFSKLFKRKTKIENNVPKKKTTNEECLRILEIGRRFDALTAKEHYVAKSEYRNKVVDYKEVVNYFRVLSNSGMLTSFCERNDISEKIVRDIMHKYEKIESVVEEANEAYIKESLVSEKEYLDNILHDVDPKISLDENQRKVILTDEDYCLVVAGAGAGKTTTVAAKVKYLVEKKNIEPSQILVISFTNKAVKELRDKINRDLGIECPIATFHSTGNAILHKHSDESLNIVDDSKMYFVILDYFKRAILTNESLVNNLILFFASYFDAPYEGKDLNTFFNKIAKATYTTMRGDLENFKEEVVESRTKRKITIQNEIVKSYQEVEIANFLYLNNIDYEYEPLYKYNITGAKKPYTPDFLIKQGEKEIYLEHFGISEDGKNDRFDEDELAAYKKAVNDKIILHKKHGTKLVYTFSSYTDGRSLNEHLAELLKDTGFDLKPKSNKEIIEKLIASEEAKYIRSLVQLVCRFISNFKVNGYNENEFKRMYHATQNERTKLFLTICEECYLEYQRFLKENDAIDFQDMINESARLLTEAEELGKKFDFRYIIVDEYQDISRQRFDLVSALSKVTEAKIIAVGDDWQSIYAFSGSDITLFTKFEEKMGYAKLLKIVNTYRNSQEVIDIAGNFIQKNKEQITKTLNSPKHIDDPVIIYTYDPAYKLPNSHWRTGVRYAIAHAVETALDHIVANTTKQNKTDLNILILGRFGFDGDNLQNAGLFEYNSRGGKVKSVKYPKLKITYMTAHASKGLGYDDVIVINGKNETYGFPAKIEDDPVLSLVIKEDHSIDYAEERRLFYVAMTRTKNRVYFIAPEKNPSEFLLEIKKEYKNVVLRGSWNENPPVHIARKPCPICGYPMQLRFKKAYGLRLYICTNEQEICGFMTNDYRAGKLSILKCDQCRDGYLVIKSSRNEEYFLGCTNYNSGGKGCNRSISWNYYYDMMHYPYENIKPEKTISQISKKNVDSEKTVNVQKQNAIIHQNTDVETVVSHEMEKSVNYMGHDLNEAVATVINGLLHMSQVRFFGKTMLVAILWGSNSEKIKTYNLDQIPEYGKLSWMKRRDLLRIVDWLIDKHYMIQTKGLYPVLHPTSDTLKYDELMTKRQLANLKVILENAEKEAELFHE